MDFLTRLFDTSDFPARWHCGAWSAGHGWLHILSDLGVWSAYVAIPCVLGSFVLRRRDIPFRTLFWLFGAFILACGATHLMEALIFWWPAYRLAGVIKLFTALVSWATVVALVPVAPRVLAMRSPEELEREVAGRTQAEDALQHANAQLERRVEERTTELARAVTSLRAEVEERKEVERQLRESREQLRLVTDQAPVLLAHCDAERRFKFVNKTYAEQFDREPGEVIGKQIADVVGEQAYARFRVPVDAALAGMPAEFEVELPPKEGRRRIFHGVNRPEFDEAGQVEGFITTISDVTVRAEAEKALRMSEELFRQLADAMPQIVWAARPDGTIDYYNERWYEFTGFPRGEADQSNWEAILHPDDVQRCLETYFGCIRQGAPYQIEYRFKDHKTGAYLWHLGRALPVKDDEGRIVRWFGASTDIDDQKRAAERLERQVRERTTELTEANERLRRSEAMFQGLFQYAPDAVIVADADGRIRHANLQAEKLFGFSRGEIVGQPVEFLIPERYHEGHRRHRAQFYSTPHTRPMGEGRDLFARHKGGGEFPVDVQLAPLETPDGMLVLSNVRDITHRKKSENIIKTNATQQAALAVFGQRALELSDLTSLLDEAAAVIARTLDVDLCRLSELTSGGDNLVMRAGWGWKPEYAGEELPSPGRGSHAGYCLVVGQPVVAPDLHAENRFTPSPVMLEYGAVSGVCVPVKGKTGSHWVLGVHSRKQRTFTTEDVVFLQVFANMLAAIIDRTRAEGQVQASLAEKEVLLREIHHRVKNNLQVISSLLDLQSYYTQDEAALEMFRESQDRVRSMSLVHERLYRSQDLAKVDFAGYIESLTDSLFHSYCADGRAVRFDLVVSPEARLSMDAAVPCGLLVNELVSNCLKHAFHGRDAGVVRIGLQPLTAERLILSVEDDGVGLADEVGLHNADTFGLQLVGMLVKQLKGTVEIGREGGTAFRIAFSTAKSGTPGG